MGQDMLDAVHTTWNALWPAIVTALLVASWRARARAPKPALNTPIPSLSGLEAEESLADRILESLVSSDFDKPTREYLPEELAKRMITVDTISGHLHKFEEELATKLRSPSRGKYEGFVRYDYNYRTELAEWISLNASKIFAIVVQCELDPIKFVLAMELFRQHGFCDMKLPILDLYKHREIFRTEIWTRPRLRDFSEGQWRLLAPVFSPEKYDYDLKSEYCIFPFRVLRTMQQAGAFSSVYRVQIHPEHQLHEGLGDVALKELKVPQDDSSPDSTDDIGANREWEREALALKAINKVRHPHVVPCIAAIKRGASRYFMFPWAAGDNLRDFWVNNPRFGLSQETILQTITQLLGMADALTKLHNYREGRRRSLPNGEGSIAVPVINVDRSDMPSMHHTTTDQDDDDDLEVPNSVSIRHGDLKPENILRFTAEGDVGLGTLKIADMGLAKQHVLATSDRNARHLITNTRYGTQTYEAPEAVTAKFGRSRLYDIWSMGCITLEFIIWILYGHEQLSSFYCQLAGGPQLPYQYYEIPDANEPTHAEVHRVVMKWIDHIATQDPECLANSALGDLLRLVRDKLLVVRLPPSSVSSRAGGRTLAPPALGGSSQFRATAEEFRDALKDILTRGSDETYLFSDKDRTNARPPAGPLLPGAHRVDSGRGTSTHFPVISGVLGRPIRADYSLPPLKDWQFPVDNRFAEQVVGRISKTAFLPHKQQVPTLCERCRSLDFWTGGFSIDDNVSNLLISAQTCDFCKLLRDARRVEDSPATDQIRFERKESNLLLTGDPYPALSILRVPEARLTHHFQIGLPELPDPNTPAFFGILNTWLEDCNVNHKDPKNKNRDCTGVASTRLPTRLIDVGTLDSPQLRLVETQEVGLDGDEYVALSHPWGDTRVYTPFSTLKTDPKSQHEVDVFKQAIPENELPATFRDALICTRQLGVRYLWIDSICIIQGEDGDFTNEAQYMEGVFSGAYCVLAASRADDQRTGFLGQRPQRNYVRFELENDEPFFVCEPIDNFNKDVIQGALNKRGWVLQERALARRTIYFTETQTYFECGCGVRCETMARMHNAMADFLGDPRFPDKAMRDPSRALKIEYFQGLYKQYSRLDFTRYEDRPFAIAGLERRLREAFSTQGGFGIFDDGDRTQIDNGLFHRSLLWKRGEDDVQDMSDGKDPGVEWLEPIDFPSERNIQVPSWSWMAYKGAIDYMDPPYGTADWETKEIIPPWTRGQKASSYPPLSDGDIALQVIVRDFNVAGSKPGEAKTVYDRERTTASDGRRAQCVVVARSKEPRDEKMKRYFVLLVTATQISEAEPRLYKRAGVGVMLGRFVGLEGDGVAARVL